MEGIQNCLNNKLFTGVCTSLCQTNYKDLLQESWIDRLIEMGVMYTWFHVYRPMGPDGCPELALTADQQFEARKFVVEMRAKKPIIIIDAYYDGEGRAVCPAATGISHHISPWGGIEPCPIVQFSKENIHDSETTLKEKFLNSGYLKEFRQLARSTTRGCIVLERPDLLKDLMERENVADGTARQTSLAELSAMEVRTSQYNPAHQIPEKNWIYRFAKRYWYNDFGVYDGYDHSETAAPTLVQLKAPESVTVE
ncbi:MAG: hypothetical protein R3C11_02245 [Planctomycetaceae bacterium]